MYQQKLGPQWVTNCIDLCKASIPLLTNVLHLLEETKRTDSKWQKQQYGIQRSSTKVLWAHTWLIPLCFWLCIHGFTTHHLPLLLKLSLHRIVKGLDQAAQFWEKWELRRQGRACHPPTISLLWKMQQQIVNEVVQPTAGTVIVQKEARAPWGWPGTTQMFQNLEKIQDTKTRSPYQCFWHSSVNSA